MKGIILAGGKGTRLYPNTKAISKQLLPIFDKPLIYYPLSILMLASIKEVLIISTPRDIADYKMLLGDGTDLGMHFEYAVQEKPNGIAEAFILGEQFIAEDSVCMILGDNIFYGPNMTRMLENAMSENEGATIFGYPVKDPTSYGVVEIDSDENVISIEEKPVNPKSNYVVPGLYFYNNDVIEIAKSIKPSSNGELEITSVNAEYLKRKKLKVKIFERGFAWLDTGTPDRMLKASNFVSSIQDKQGFYVSCIEEIAYRRGFISLKQLEKLGMQLKNTNYGQYILDLVKMNKA